MTEWTNKTNSALLWEPPSLETEAPFLAKMFAIGPEDEEDDEEEEEFELDEDDLDDVSGGGRGAPTSPTFGGQRACGC